MALSPLSAYWRDQQKVLQQQLWGMSSEGSVGTKLAQVFRQSLTHHVQQYVPLLQSLRDTIGEVGGRGPGAARHACHLWGSRGRRAMGTLAQGTRLSQEPWFEKDQVRLCGHSCVLGGLKGHVFALGAPRYLALSWLSPQRPREQTWNRILLGVRTQGAGPAEGAAE